jgi:SAM-dependent methyltransferase
MRRPGAPPPPPRVRVIERELDRFAASRYLEIGVGDGTAFFHVRAHRQVGVDPAGLSLARRLRHPLVALRSRIVRARSDDYFADLDPEVGFDVVFVDGHHTYEQALRDVENSLRHLSEEGVVLMHDCNPPTEESALPDLLAAAATGGDGWCGDVWKTIVHLRATRPDLRVSVLDIDYGIGVVRRGASDTLPLSVAKVAGLHYADLEASRAELLGLREP